MDQKNDQKTEGLTFTGILRLFKGKMKLLICLALIAAVIGGAVGACMTYMNVSYGGEVVFYLSSTDDTRAILTLISSESFAEKLLLDENGLPPKEDCDPVDYETALNAAKAYNEARARRTALYKEQTLFAAEFATYESEYRKLDEEYKRIFEILSIYKGAMTDEVAKDENHVTETQKYEKLLEEAAAARKEYKTNVYDKKLSHKLDIELQIAQTIRTWKDARTAYEEASEKLLVEWRKDPKIAALVKQIQTSISCEYLRKFDDLDESKKNAENSENYENPRFLSISVMVDKDEKTANMIIENLMAIAPEYIEKNLEKFTGVAEAQCTIVSTFATAEEKYEKSPIVAIATSAIIGAGAVAAVTIFVIILVGLLPEDLAPKKKKAKNGDGENNK